MSKAGRMLVPTQFAVSLLRAVLVASLCASLLTPPASAVQTDAKSAVKTKPHPKKYRYRGVGFLPGYHQPPPLSEWRDRSVRYGGGARSNPYEVRYWDYYGRLRYGWGGPGFYHG